MQPIQDFDRKESLLLGRAAGLYAARLAFKQVHFVRLAEMRKFFEAIETEEAEIRKELSNLYYCKNRDYILDVSTA
jgi:hypothetical protein